MKRILQKTAFIALTICMALVNVASSGIIHHTQSSTNVLDCLIAPSLTSQTELFQDCKNTYQGIILPPPIIAPTPKQKTEQELFLAAITYKLPTIPQPDTYEYTLLRAYGAVFVNQEPEIKLPPKVVFANEPETKQFQSTLTIAQVNNTRNCYLQKAAAEALNKAKAQVQIPLKSGYGASDCIRTFDTNLRFWRKYANNKTLERVREGEETAILGVVAPPGTSQHLWGLAIDLRITNKVQEQALNQNGWFRTVESDVPHWTYVGLSEEKLLEVGFKTKIVRGITYWVTPLQ
jgi:D-alanyl-D-alanine dipeptidase